LLKQVVYMFTTGLEVEVEIGEACKKFGLGEK
jgi:hypothetical protein